MRDWNLTCGSVTTFLGPSSRLPSVDGARTGSLLVLTSGIESAFTSLFLLDVGSGQKTLVLGHCLLLGGGPGDIRLVPLSATGSRDK